MSSWHRQIFHLPVVVAPGDERRNGREEAENSVEVQGERDAPGQGAVVPQPDFAQPAEKFDQPVNRSEQAEERRGADDDFQNHQAVFHHRHLLAGGGFEGAGIFRLGQLRRCPARSNSRLSGEGC